MKRGDAFPSKYLSKEDIKKPTIAVIEHVLVETVGQGEKQDTKPILYFQNDLKPMVCNATNWDTLEALYGDESDNWFSKSIEIWVDPTVVYGGKREGGLRLRAPSTNGAEVMTAEQAKAAVLAAGLTVDDLKAILPERDGKRVYSPERDTQKVRDLINQNTPVTEVEL